jgi:hypothetical protein
MLVLSGVFNTRILDTMNYTNQDYVHVNYTLIVIYSMLLSYCHTLPDSVNGHPTERKKIIWW